MTLYRRADPENGTLTMYPDMVITKMYANVKIPRVSLVAALTLLGE